MKKFLFLSLFPLFAFSGNLNELLNLAEQNKQVEASRYSLEASKEKEYATKSAYLPNLTLGASQTFNQESNMFAAEKNTTGTATLAFTIYDGGKREASFEQQQALVKSATFSLASVQNNISLDVIYYYYNYLSTLANKESTLKKMEQLEAERNRLEKFLSVGAITADELQKIVSSIEQTKVDLLTLDNTLNNISNTLEYLTGQEVSVQKGSTIVYKENTNLAIYWADRVYDSGNLSFCNNSFLENANSLVFICGIDVWNVSNEIFRSIGNGSLVLCPSSGCGCIGICL